MPEQSKPKIFLGFIIFVLTGIFILGLKWIFSLGQEAVSGAPFLVFDYAVGLTMIFLPCTLPLAFVIVPLSMGKSYAKGIGLALSFGFGILITLSFYGVLIGFFGGILGADRIEFVKDSLYVLAGAFAVYFALKELGLIHFKTVGWELAIPGFVQNQKDYLKAGLMGLFLGNVGIGCPNPLFNAVIIPQIAVLASPLQGFLIMFVQALGRITPLLILAFLGILGYNATQFLVRRQTAVLRMVGWSTIFIGGFLFTLGLFGHGWWVYSGIHTGLEFLTRESRIADILAVKVQTVGHTHEISFDKGSFSLPIEWGTPIMLFLWIFPMFWFWLRKRKEIGVGGILTEEIKIQTKKYFNLMFWLIAVFSLLLIMIFNWILPHQFLEHWSIQIEDRHNSLNH